MSDFDFGRAYFNGCAPTTASTFPALARFEPLVGPLTATPQRSLAQVVAGMVAT